MQPHRATAIVSDDHSLHVGSVPFAPGDAVDVFIVPQQLAGPASAMPLRGTPVTLIEPTEPAAASDWEAAR